MNRQFPPEIVQLIVKASLDRYDLLDYYHSDPKLRHRYATLKSYSLLNSTWCGASHAELVKWVEIRTDNSAIRFLELVQLSGGTLGGVKDMSVYSADLTDASTLAKLLRCTPQVSSLYVSDASVDIEDLAQLHQLRRLRLGECSIVGSLSSSLLRLPHLRQLSLVACPIDESALHFFTPAFLPQLRRVDTDDLDSLAPLAQQLEIIIDYSHDRHYAILARAKSLLLLAPPFHVNKRLDMFAKLPSLPPFLHAAIPPYDFSYNPDAEQELVEALEYLLETEKSGLRVILLDDYGIDDSIKSVIQQFMERGVRVQMVDDDLYFNDGAVEEMDKIRAEEQRASEAAVMLGE